MIATSFEFRVSSFEFRRAKSSNSRLTTPPLDFRNSLLVTRIKAQTKKTVPAKVRFFWLIGRSLLLLVQKPTRHFINGTEHVYAVITEHIHFRCQHLHIAVEIEELLEQQGKFPRETNAVAFTNLHDIH